jgi:hypothetical protein
MRLSLRRIGLAAAICLTAAPAGAAVPLDKEPGPGEMRLGQRVRVDDGSCPAGQVREVTAAKLNADGSITRTSACVKR